MLLLRPRGAADDVAAMGSSLSGEGDGEGRALLGLPASVVLPPLVVLVAGLFLEALVVRFRPFPGRGIFFFWCARKRLTLKRYCVSYCVRCSSFFCLIARPFKKKRGETEEKKVYDFTAN